MSVNGTWQELPRGHKIAADKNPLNLMPEEVLQFQDLTENLVPGSLSLRNISEVIDATEFVRGPMHRIGVQIREDGTVVYCAVALVGGQYRLYVRNPQNGSWITTFGGFPLLNLGTDGTDLAISPNAFRACGEDGLAAVVKLGTKPYIEGDAEVMPRQFHETLGLQAGNYAGIGFVSWNGKINAVSGANSANPTRPSPVLLTVTRIEPTGSLPNRRRGRRSRRRQNEVDPDGNPIGIVNTWFGKWNSVKYFLTFVYEGGQEGPPSQASDTLTFSEDENWVSISISIPNVSEVPKSVKRINLYRSLARGTEEAAAETFKEGPENAVLIGSFEVYKETDDFENWEYEILSGRHTASKITIDENEDSVIGGTYFDRQQLSHEVVELSPNRQNHRLFMDRMYAWNVEAEDGKIYGTRLYYSHVNGIGVPCYDIIPPANYIEFPFNISGLVSARSHRIVIGDSKYAIGYFGGSVDRWTVFEGETEIGCKAPDSVVDTPRGAMYVGYDGIYIVNGFEVSPPLARGIIRSTEDRYDWSKAKAAFAQNEQEYVVVVPSNPLQRNFPIIVAFNLRTGGTRIITGLPSSISAIGTNAQGGIIIATSHGLMSLESVAAQGDAHDSPTPVYETGFLRFVGAGNYQNVKKFGFSGRCSPGNLKITRVGYPSMSEATIELDAISEDGFFSKAFPAESEVDFSHKFKIEYADKEGKAPEEFRVDKMFVKTAPIQRELD